LATQCTSKNGVTDAGRQDALNAFNDNRRKAVNGLLQNGANAGDNLPHGKNMYKLEWDCGLESLAEFLLTQDCSVPPTTLPNNGIGAAVVTPAPATVDAVITGAVATWPPLLQANAIAKPAAVTDPMIQDKATKVGCTAKLCTGANPTGLAVCVYDVPGNGVCTAASAATDCTTYTPSTCDIATGLCLKTDATTTAATTTAAAAATTASASSVVTPSGGELLQK
ncbi:unnamed protein product, partial [Heligmosomoides polygyrus]|uniref:SCP domain-containing protein n=1 Tax=Heligmosomoides polygyrus TaxID=6339 RepID=A0A183FU71_HELPZ